MTDYGESGAKVNGSVDRLTGTATLFISYSRSDRTRALWIAETLSTAGYNVIIQDRDFVPGSGWIDLIDSALKVSDRTIAVLSQDYLRSDYCRLEWQATVRKDPLGRETRLIPVRVAEHHDSGLLGSFSYIDLVGLSDDAAKTMLVRGVAKSVFGASTSGYEQTVAGALPSDLAEAASSRAKNQHSEYGADLRSERLSAKADPEIPRSVSPERSSLSSIDKRSFLLTHDDVSHVIDEIMSVTLAVDEISRLVAVAQQEGDLRGVRYYRNLLEDQQFNSQRLILRYIANYIASRSTS